jgi:hypothetical protein
MRVLTLTGVIIASASLAACQASSPPRSAGSAEAAIAQDAQPAPSAPSVAPTVAELPPANTGAPAAVDANGPPLNILKAPR